MTSNPRLIEALANAARGWCVFPAAEPRADGSGCSCTRGADCADPGKHPRIKGWREEATTDEEKIRRWWAKWPQAGVAIATGAASGLVVLDVDPRNGGDESLRNLEAKHGDLPPTPQSLTGGGGAHYLFSHPGREIRNMVGDKDGKGGVAPGLDIRGDGGLIIAPGSRHISGGQYVWEVSAHPEDVPVAPMPAWLLDTMTAAPSGNGARPRVDTAAVLAGVPEGQRDDALFRLASKLRRADVPRDTAEELVIAAAGNCDPPFPAEDALAKVENAYTRYAPSTNGSQPKSATEPSPTFPRTDAGNAELFAHLYRDRLRYDHQRGCWLLWDGWRWQPDPDAEVYRLAIEATRTRYRNAEKISDLNERREEVVWAIKGEKRAAIEATLALGKAQPGIADTGEGWDSDPWLLNVKNGTLELRTGELREHREADRITKLVPTDCDPDAKCPTWDAFLDRILGDRPELVEYLQRLVGYSMVGVTIEQIIILLIGLGSNGKSTLEEALLDLFADYATMAAPGLLLTSRNERHPTELADLYGKRFVMSMEVGEGKRLAETLVKQLSGSDTIKARRMNEDFWSFTPTHQLWLGANCKPEIKGTDLAIWRRIRLIPFDVVIPPAERNKKLPAELKTELQGILAWSVRGCLAWQKDGLEPPEAVTAATAAYQEESDVLADFLVECCVTGDGYSVQASKVYKQYAAWAEALPKSERLSSTMFGRRMADRFSKTKRHGVNIYQGITLHNGKIAHQATLADEAKGEGLGEGSESGTPVLPLREPISPRVESNLQNPPNPPDHPPEEHCQDCEAELNYYDPEGTAYCAKHGPGPPGK